MEIGKLEIHVLSQLHREMQLLAKALGVETIELLKVAGITEKNAIIQPVEELLSKEEFSVNGREFNKQEYIKLVSKLNDVINMVMSMRLQTMA
ncbi:hypothetical protein V6C27_00560 [Peptococcaceae bacterium 1198_IL3148]